MKKSDRPPNGRGIREKQSDATPKSRFHGGKDL